MILWWRRGVSLIVLFVLAGTPAMAAVCDALCSPYAGAAPATHHDPAAGHHESAMPDCHDVGPAERGSVLTSAPCDHLGDPGSAAVLAASREDTRILLAAARGLMLSGTGVPGMTALLSSGSPKPQTTPPRPAAAPLALRI